MTTAEADQNGRIRKERLVRCLYEEAYISGNYELLDGLIAPDHEANDGDDFDGQSNGPERVKAPIGGQQTASPDVQVDVRIVPVDGDTAAAHLPFSGTHDGPFVVGQDDDPFVAERTGTAFGRGDMRSFRFEGGTVVESHMDPEELDTVLALGIAGEFDEYVASLENPGLPRA